MSSVLITTLFLPSLLMHAGGEVEIATRLRLLAEIEGTDSNN